MFVTGVRRDFDTAQGWKPHPGFTARQAGGRQEHRCRREAGAAAGSERADGASREGTDEHRGSAPAVDEQRCGRRRPLTGGQRVLPAEIGDRWQVLEDDPRRAVILGMLHSRTARHRSDDNHEKLYKSRSGMRLYFNDDKKVVLLETPAGNRLTLSEDDQGLKLEDQNGNKLEFTAQGVKLESAAGLEIKAAGELKLSGQSAELSSSGTTTVKGASVAIN